jgi:hypothetical protein
MVVLTRKDVDAQGEIAEEEKKNTSGWIQPLVFK